jgi:tetratricopeptide (TPR) repeat protein
LRAVTEKFPRNPAVTEKFPRNPKAHRLVVEILKKRGQLKDQVDGWEQSVRGGAKDQADIFRLGFYYQIEGQDAKAMEVFANYAQSHPEDDGMRWFLADLQLERGQLDKALPQYRQLEDREKIVGAWRTSSFPRDRPEEKLTLRPDIPLLFLAASRRRKSPGLSAQALCRLGALVDFAQGAC